MKPDYLAAVLTAPGRFEYRRLPLPAPAPGDVRVRLHGCGVCASDFPAWEGRGWFRYPLEPGAPGHEGWGLVDAVGDTVTHVRVGDRVALLSGDAFAEVAISPADQVVSLPPGLGVPEFPGASLGCAINILRRSQILPHHHVAIVGVGFLGSLLTQLVSHTGAKTYAVARRPFAQTLAAAMGATRVIAFGEHRRVIDEIMRLTGGVGCDRVIECVGLQDPLDLAAELVAERGRLVIAGFHQEGRRTVDMRSWNWRGLDVVNAHERDPLVASLGVAAAAVAIEERRLDPAPLYTHRFRLTDLDGAFTQLRDRPDGFCKALVLYDH
jgi:threonine dehydrogenase-like Zn-dependent dehydrogenase